MTIDAQAIFKAYPSAHNVDSEYGVFDKAGNKITIEQSKVDQARTTLNTEAAAVKYKSDRATAYDPITEQLDQLYWDKKNGTNKWVEAIDKVKSDNPKP